MYSYGSVGAPAYPVMTKEDEGKTAFTNAAPSGRDKMSPYSTASAGTHEMARSGHPGLLSGGLPVHTQQVLIFHSYFFLRAIFFLVFIRVIFFIEILTIKKMT